MRQLWWLTAALSVICASDAFSAWNDVPPDDAYGDWFLVDNQSEACRNINPKEVRDYTNSPKKLPEWMLKVGPTTPSLWLAALRDQGKNPHTILVTNPYSADLNGLVFENIWYKEGDKVSSRNFFQNLETCRYVVAHQELPTSVDVVVMTIDGDTAKAVTMGRQEFNSKVLAVGR